MNKVASFSKAKCSLRKYHIAERMGFLFICLAGTAPELDAIFRDFRAIHSPWPIDTLVTKRHRSFEVSCNWKAFLDIFNEYYHLPYVHPTSIDHTYDEPDDAEVVRGGFATHFGTTDGTGGLLDGTQEKALPVISQLEGRLRAGVRYSWLFPNIIVALGSDAMWLYEVYPDGPDRCRCAQVVSFPQSTIDHPDFPERVSSYYERFDMALEEDIPMLEEQHAGMRSPFARQGMFSYLEPSVANFARWYAGRLLGRESQ